MTDTSPSMFLNDRGRLVPKLLGDHIEQEAHMRLGVDGRLWRYVNGCYRPDGEAHARAMTRRLLGREVRAQHFTEVLRYLEAVGEPTVTDRPPDGWINVTNGLLDWRTGELHPHTPEVVTTVQLPVDWHPEAECPGITRFMGQVLPDEATASMVLEFIGLCLVAGLNLRRVLLLLGPGRNGKSVLLAIIKALLGPANCAAVPLQLLGENRFAAAELFGKLANVAGDLDARGIRQTDIFKMATGGDPIMAERKNCHPFTFTPFATFIFAANEAPISSDQTDAWFDRWLVVPLERRIPDDEVDPHLAAKLTAADELAGLLVLAVDGLRRLVDRGRFDLPEPVAQAGEVYRDRLDTVRGFLNEMCVITPDAWIPRAALYKEYRRWATESGRLPVSATNFNDHLRSNLGRQIEERTRKGTRGWGGITTAGLTPVREAA